MLKCGICGREATNSGYCVLHEKARQSVAERYERWREALRLTWRDYLNEIIKNPATGAKAREVAETLLKETQ